MKNSRSESWPRFMGRFELLESRTVLSATAGSVGYEVLDGNARPIQALPEVGSVNVHVADFEQPPSNPAYDYNARPGLLANAWHDQQEQTDHYLVLFVSYRPPQFARTSESAISASDPDSIVPPPLAAQAPHSDNTTTQHPTVDPALASLANSIWISNSTINPDASVSTLQEVSNTSEVDRHDVAFQEYWSEAVLPQPAASQDDDHLKFFDRLSTFEEEVDNVDEANEPNKEGAYSLADVLTRELAAIDSVLSELHEFQFRRHDQEPSPGNNLQPQANPTDQAEIVLAPPSECPRTEQPPVNLADGGMVLLEADSNLDDIQNIAAVFAQELNRAGVEPLGVEISAGIYQAFEVGSSPASQANPVVESKTARNSFSNDEIPSEMPKSDS